MSIVMACATPTRVVVKCDGREIDPSSNKIISEDTIKFAQITPECIIGYTGNKQFCEECVNRFKRSIETYNPFDNIDLFQDILAIQSYKIHTESDFITGKWNNKIILWALTYRNTYSSLIDQSPGDKETSLPSYIIIGSKEMGNLDGFETHYQAEKSIELNMNNYIRYVSGILFNINDHITTCKIRV